jgi:hypothetical protein
MVYGSAFAAVVPNVHDAEVLLVEPAEVNGSKVNGPEVFAHLLETEGFEAEKVGNEDLPVLPADGLVLGDFAKLEMRGVGNVLHTTGERPIRGSIDGARGLECEGFMGPLLVEDAPKGVEAPLLGAEVLAGGAGGVGLEGAVHALVSAVLVGTGRLDQLGPDPELDPVDGELGESGDGNGREGDPVVALDDAGKPVDPEEAVETAQGMGLIDTEHALAVEEEAAIAILHGEGIAELSITRAELTLEIDGPDGVGSVHGRERGARMSALATRLAGRNDAGTDEDLVDGVDAGHLVELAGNHAPDLAGAPATMLAELKDPSLNLGIGGVRTGIRPMGAVLEARGPELLVAFEPLVAGGTAYAEPATELAEGMEASLGLHDEAESLVHGARSSPGHRSILLEGVLQLEGENCKPSAPYVL